MIAIQNKIWKAEGKMKTSFGAGTWERRPSFFSLLFRCVSAFTPTGRHATKIITRAQKERVFPLQTSRGLKNLLLSILTLSHVNDGKRWRSPEPGPVRRHPDIQHPALPGRSRLTQMLWVVSARPPFVLTRHFPSCVLEAVCWSLLALGKVSEPAQSSPGSRGSLSHGWGCVQGHTAHAARRMPQWASVGPSRVLSGSYPGKDG